MATDCPHCHKPIEDDEALLCLYCGESLKRPIGNFGKLKYAWTKYGLLALIVIIVLGFLISQIFF